MAVFVPPGGFFVLTRSALRSRGRSWAGIAAACLCLSIPGSVQGASLAEADRRAAPEAELVVSGAIAELDLRGAELSALAERLAEASGARIEIHAEGQRLFAAELRELAVEDERQAMARRALARDPACLRLDDRDALHAALRTHSLPGQNQAGDAEVEPRLDEEVAALASAETDLVTVPEPSTAPLLGAGLVALLLVARRL